MTTGNARSFQGTLRYRFADCSLGRLIVACLGDEVCYLAFGNSDEALIQGLKERFPAADLVLASDLSSADKAILAIENPHSAPDVPVVLSGTTFQKQVWAALRRVGCGDTATYAGTADAIGRPAAARAVASACGANPVGILVPCHRIVGSDGSLRGYRWGIDLKRRLLERERV